MKTLYVNKKIKMIILLFSAISFLSVADESESFLMKYDFSSVISGQGGREDPSLPPQHDKMLFSTFIAVSEHLNSSLSEHSSTKAQFSFSGWSQISNLDVNNLDYADAIAVIDKEQYYEFSITPQPGFVVRLSQIDCKLGRTATGPRLFAVSSSYDNHTSLLPLAYRGSSDVVQILADKIFLWADESTSLSNHQIIMDLETDKTIQIRFYAWAAEDEKGKFSIDNVEVSGELYPNENFSEMTDPDTLDFQTSFNHVNVLEDSSFLEFLVADKPYVQELRMPCPYVEAVLNLYNPSDSKTLVLKQPSIQIVDEDGEDWSRKFRLQWDGDYRVHPKSESAVLLRLVPDRNLYELSDSVSLCLKGDFVSFYEDDSLQLNVLHPMRFSLETKAFPKMAYVFPKDTGYIFVRAYNDERKPALPFAWKSYSSANAQVDTMLLQTLRENEYKDWQLDYCLTDSLSALKMTLADYAPDIAYYRLMNQCGNHRVAESLAEDASMKVFMDDGRIKDVYCVDTVSFYEWKNDTVLQLRYHNKQEDWPLLTLPYEAKMDSLSLHQLMRADSSLLSLEYYWHSENQSFMLDTLAHQDSLVYFLHYSWLPTIDRSIYVNLYDSICLGDLYQANGFDLPEFSEPGDYLFKDTLLAVNGVDSIVSLYLNVCDKPAAPEQIYGDSIVVKAGRYLYTIKPVPSAAFYVWTVLPEAWLADCQSNTIVLTIPYSGNGEISVRAVNRCGQSQATFMNVQADLLTDRQTASFSVYPGSGFEGFNLQVNDLSGKTSVLVHDTSGKLLYQESRILKEEQEYFQIPMDDYAGAVYMISIVNEHYHSSAMVLKE